MTTPCADASPTLHRQRLISTVLMLDYPPYTQGCDLIVGQWRAFEEVYASKRVRTIAVSNFLADQSELPGSELHAPGRCSAPAYS